MTEPSVDFHWVLVLTGAFLFQPTLLGEQRLVRGTFLVSHRRRITGHTPQAMAVAIGQVGRDLDLLPVLGDKGFGFRLKLLGHQLDQKGRVREPGTVITAEEIAQDDTARRLIDIDIHEDRATV